MNFKVTAPPIKSQGIKTKLVPWIRSILPKDFEGVWVEPFMGTGAVAFNIAPKRALLCDTNPHLVAFYSGIKNGEITHELVNSYLTKEGTNLLDKGQDHYYFVRDRFNAEHSPLDFLFLNRAGFNGMIRFNRKGGFNIPFCRKPNRFAQAYVTKITNQVAWVEKLLRTREFTFKCQRFEDTIAQSTHSDLIYCDPPYIDRHVDYYNGWDGEQEKRLFDILGAADVRFILSTWHHNDYRANEYMETLWARFSVLTRDHFYHVGAREENRNPMVEALVTNFEAVPKEEGALKREQLVLLEEHAKYVAA
ncbi:MAG TPA: Dam family site-specific DNA-(adenine-N6)-methyltransferase [Rhodanobacteraceae bacterium]|nr:Dam family site-specific DNA-(adenine-N6)-methyltransferase [Rhodanobacteraceae bacterium]